jgi:hypothetical protein
MPEPGQPIDEFRRFIAGQGEALRALLCAPARPVMVSGLNPNIGHQYHNELAALETLDGRLAGVSTVLGPHDYFDLAVLHGLDPTSTQRCGPHEVGEYCLARGLSPFWPSTVGAPASLGRRVIAWAERRAAHVAEEMRLALGSGKKAILFMLRSNRRVWLSQREGVLAAITQLARRHRVTHFMLDGVTATNHGDPHERAWIEAEHDIAEDLRRSLGDMPNLVIVSLVGRSIEEKIVAHGFVSFAVAPKGNGALPSLSWIHNIPLIEHGNAFDLPQAMVETKYREDALLPLLVDRDAIIDTLGPQMDRGVEQFEADVQLQTGYDLHLPALLALIEEATLRVG